MFGLRGIAIAKHSQSSARCLAGPRKRRKAQVRLLGLPVMATGRGQVAKPQLVTSSSVLLVRERVSKSAIVVLGRVLINDADRCQTFSAASINSAARTAKGPKNASRCARIVAATSCGSGARINGNILRNEPRTCRVRSHSSVTRTPGGKAHLRAVELWLRERLASPPGN